VREGRRQDLARLDGRRRGAAQGCRDSSALDRNVEFGRKFRINGTPALVFEDGTRKPGALPAAEVEKLLAEANRKS
jgi:thiol:disulfide interchange protein DsbC